MAADSVTLREYLVRLGFSVDKTESKKGEEALQRWEKRANTLAKALAGVATTTVAMVATFANGMEKLYYASRRTDSAVGNLQALDFAGRKSGIKDIQQSLEAMASNLRANPGLTGLLQSLGVQVKGRDKSDVLVDLAKQLKKMPFFQAQAYGNLFGIDPQTLFMLLDRLDDFQKDMQERKNLAAAMGIDTEKAAKDSMLLANQWRDTLEYAGLFRDVLVTAILPKASELGDVSREVLKTWIGIVQQGDVWSRLMEGVGLKQTGGGVVLSDDSKKRLGQGEADSDTIIGDSSGTAPGQVFRKKWLDRQYDKFMVWSGAKKYKTPLADQASVDAAQDDSAFKSGGTGAKPPTLTPPPSASGSGGVAPDGGPMPKGADAARQLDAAQKAAPLFARLEKQYGLPSGWLGRVWAQESRRGGSMTSPVGAQGHFQFMPATAQQYGLTNPNDLAQSAEASAKMYSNLLNKYGGDQQKAAAAYNWGEGRVDKYGLGRAPAETRGYINAVVGGGGANQAAGTTVNQNNNISISGVSDPKVAAKEVGNEINQANADVLRNQKARVQ